MKNDTVSLMNLLRYNIAPQVEATDEDPPSLNTRGIPSCILELAGMLSSTSRTFTHNVFNRPVCWQASFYQ